MRWPSDCVYCVDATDYGMHRPALRRGWAEHSGPCVERKRLRHVHEASACGEAEPKNFFCCILLFLVDLRTQISSPTATVILLMSRTTVGG